VSVSDDVITAVVGNKLNAFIPATQVNAERMTNRLNRP